MQQESEIQKSDINDLVESPESEQGTSETTSENIETTETTEHVQEVQEEERDHFPSVLDVRKKMRMLSLQLYRSWRKELALRLLNLELEGYIAQDHVMVSSAVWRLPNDEIRYALNRLQQDLQDKGFKDYQFKFDRVDETSFVMLYKIDIPELEDELDDDELESEMKELLSCQDSPDSCEYENRRPFPMIHESDDESSSTLTESESESESESNDDSEDSESSYASSS